jgi:uncharacterized peroxidase-related enzyme
MIYTIYSISTAPDAAREALAGVQKALGFVPNMLGTMAGAPAVLEAYQTAGALFDKTSLSTTERNVVVLATSVENGCEYCVSVHTALAAMQKVPGDVVQSIRDGVAIADPKLEALRRFTAAVVISRGHPLASDLAAIERAGYSNAQVLEIVLGVGLKTIANYANNIAKTPLDEAFAAVTWKRAAA